MTAADVAAAAKRLAERSCREQGIPLAVADPDVLRRVANILTINGNGKGAPKGAPTDVSTFAATSPQGGRRG